RLATKDVGNEFKTFAEELGLDANQFNDCFNSGKYLDEINNDLQDGTSYGITGTPGFFIGNDEMGYIKVSGAQPYSVFQNILNQMLAS
ncbi:MAG: DsbA family protein, partial [Nitrosopumilus sp.]